MRDLSVPEVEFDRLEIFVAGDGLGDRLKSTGGDQVAAEIDVEGFEEDILPDEHSDLEG